MQENPAIATVELDSIFIHTASVEDKGTAEAYILCAPTQPPPPPPPPPPLRLLQLCRTRVAVSWSVGTQLHSGGMNAFH